jgi:hypothetical protein
MTQYYSVHKWLTFGIILLLVSITIIPSISHNIVTASIISNSSETEKNNLFQSLSERDILLKIVKKIIGIRVSICDLLLHYSAKIEYPGEFPEITIIHPLTFLLFLAFVWRTAASTQFWLIISELLYWGWTIKDITGSW